MTNFTPHRRLAVLAAAISLAAAACATDGPAAEPAVVSLPTTTPSTAPPPTTASTTTPSPTTPSPTTVPPTSLVADEPGRAPDVDLVAITIDEIGVSAAVPAGWESALGGIYAGPVAALEFEAELSADMPDIAALGFVPIGERVAAGHTWQLHGLDAGAMFIGVALTEIGDVTYSVALQVAPHLADQYLESVVMPVLESFEAGELPEIVRTLAGTPPEGAPLGAELDRLVAGTDLPAVGVTVFDGDQTIESAVAGVRRTGDQTLVELTDAFSIGSNVKAMTATLVGTFVDDGLISWDTTVADVYTDSLGELDASMADVTVRQLLTHTAGLNDVEAGFTSTILGESDDHRSLDRPLVEQRAEIAASVFTRPGQHPAGEHMYSNIGYTTVGAMLEHLTGESYEQLLQTRLFDALGMGSCGFYAPGTPGQVDQPWGHIADRAGRPVDPGHPDAELGHAIAPAGTVHCSMTDWARFLQSQLRGFQGSDAEIVSPEVFEALTTPAPGTNYALGWTIFTQPDGSEMIWHNGSNGRFTSEAWLVPGEGRGVLMITNVGVQLAQAPMQLLVDATFARYADDEGAGS